MKMLDCDWLAKRGGVLQKYPQAFLRVSFESGSGIRVANQPWAFSGPKLVSPHPCISVKSVVEKCFASISCFLV
jgi:hypothetical protein